MSFPSLHIRSTSLDAQGSFAEAQASFLTPDKESIAELDALLKENYFFRLTITIHFGHPNLISQQPK